ncbi:hypothetical protein [Asticcacaulis sp. EMRT-3]|uniref:hypothetical protein n=1 Tax=Asticcacaulis sp. EMRT-3 TaxID=3040349 RepID=UPI0024AF5E48|nr:hypothetical protein [Asticcacaulis sp. EMRT-3]MDI7775453.1 hypothetical protein [Asticcacaulis sp. EMRT-3]
MPYTRFSETASAMRQRPAPFVPDVSDVRRDLIARQRKSAQLRRLIQFGTLTLVVAVALAGLVWRLRVGF